jgi:hypothetical protein
VRSDGIGRCDVLAPNVEVRRTEGDREAESTGVPTFVGVGDNEDVEVESERLGRFLSSSSE